MSKNMINKSTRLALGLVALLAVFGGLSEARAAAVLPATDPAAVEGVGEGSEHANAVAGNIALNTADHKDASRSMRESARCCGQNEVKVATAAQKAELAAGEDGALVSEVADDGADPIAQDNANASFTEQAGLEAKPENANCCDVAVATDLEQYGGDKPTSASSVEAVGMAIQAVTADAAKAEARAPAPPDDAYIGGSLAVGAAVMGGDDEEEAANGGVVNLEALVIAASPLGTADENGACRQPADQNFIEGGIAEVAGATLVYATTTAADEAGTWQTLAHNGEDGAKVAKAA